MKGLAWLSALLFMLSCSSLNGARGSASKTGMQGAETQKYVFNRAVEKYNGDKLDEALDLFYHSAMLDTASAASCYYLAQFYMSVGDRAALRSLMPAVDRLLAKAVALEPENYWYRRLYAINMLRQNRKDDAIAQYEEMFSLFPGRTDLLLTLAQLYEETGDYEKELRALTRYGQIEDVADELKLQRVACYLELGELDSAFLECDDPDQIINILVESTGQMIDRIDSEMSRMQAKSMIDMVSSFCDVAIKYSPGMASAWKGKITTRFWLGEKDKAEKMFEQALDSVRSPDGRAMLFSLRGDYHNVQKDKQRMYADYDSTLAYQPENIMVLNNYAYFLSLDGRDLQRALDMSAITIKAEPMNATYLDTYAWILFRLGRYSEARTYLEQAIQYLEEDNSDIFEHYGDVLFKCGDASGALDNWHRAYQLNPSSPLLERKIKEKTYVEE